MAAEPGFEPELRDPKSLVLPLHYSAICLVPRAGLQPARACGPMDLETIASTMPPPRRTVPSVSSIPVPQLAKIRIQYRPWVTAT